LYSDAVSKFYPKYISNFLYDSYTEITLEQFQKYVLKKEETMKKEIIVGYKLIKRKYKDAVLKILDRINFTQTPELTQDWSINKIKEAGVLDLWFEPVYKKVEKVIKMGDAFALKVNSEGIFHGTENITDYVKSIYEWNKTIPTKFGKYDFEVDFIGLSKTGCENKNTSVDEWINVWREYQELV
jgi:hypothetical protein